MDLSDRISSIPPLTVDHLFFFIKAGSGKGLKTRQYHYMMGKVLANTCLEALRFIVFYRDTTDHDSGRFDWSVVSRPRKQKTKKLRRLYSEACVYQYLAIHGQKFHMTTRKRWLCVTIFADVVLKLLEVKTQNIGNAVFWLYLPYDDGSQNETFIVLFCSRRDRNAQKASSNPEWFT